jgi:hypothetical protein
MEESGRFLRVFYKKIEDDINHQLFFRINTPDFIERFGEYMESHLDTVEGFRKCSERWLEEIGYPTREYIADVAKNLIKLEDRLDCLEYELFQTGADFEQYRLKIAGLIDDARSIVSE